MREGQKQRCFFASEYGVGQSRCSSSQVAQVSHGLSAAGISLEGAGAGVAERAGEITAASAATIARPDETNREVIMGRNRPHGFNSVADRSASLLRLNLRELAAPHGYSISHG